MTSIVFWCTPNSLESGIVAGKYTGWDLSSESITLSDLRRALSGNRCCKSGNSESGETHGGDIVVEDEADEAKVGDEIDEER